MGQIIANRKEVEEELLKDRDKCGVVGRMVTDFIVYGKPGDVLELPPIKNKKRVKA